jgi:KDO2-lipid IV(A) lauroyltransferase
MYYAWVVVSALVRQLPLRVSYGVAIFAGTAAFYGWPRGRRATLRNYHVVCPGAGKAELRGLARRSLVNYCRYLVDFIRFPALVPAELVREAIGEAKFTALSRSLEAGKGAIIVCMHFGNWDLGAGATAARGYQLSVVAETFRDPRLDRTVVAARKRLGMNVVKMEGVSPSIFRTLKRNGLLALLIDRPDHVDGVAVEFFGRMVRVPAGPARIAIRSGAAVIPVAFPRRSAWSPVVEVLADFTVTDVGGDEESRVCALTQQIISAHERFIRDYPDQWYMFREMWPAREQGALS